jgi:hypothetical protein
MFTLFELVMYGLPVLVFVGLDGPKVVSNTAIRQYTRFKRLNNLVETKYKSAFMILYVSLLLIFQMLWYNFAQWVNKSLVQKKGKLYEITYVINGQKNKLVVLPKRGPKDVMLVTGDNLVEKDNEITNLVDPYLGPRCDFHGATFTPAFFNMESMTFQMADNRELTFTKNQRIIFDNVENVEYVENNLCE